MQRTNGFKYRTNNRKLNSMTNKTLHLWMITGLVFLYACSSQDLAVIDDRGQEALDEQKELIRDHIQDPEKQKQLLQVVSEIEQESIEFFNYYQDHNRKLTKLNRNYASTLPDFEQMFADFNRNYDAYLRMLIHKRAEMQKLTSRDEWSNIMDRKSSYIPE